MTEKQTIRTRFAPSPTGNLHLGGARTALFSWLYAKHHQGEFLLRIEDTDLARSNSRFTDSILAGMHWLGLDSDAPPVFQSQRTALYQAAIEQLLESGHAYRCTCSKETCDAVREKQIKDGIKPRYNGHCRDLNVPATIGTPYVIRFKNPLHGHVCWTDAVAGEIQINNSELDDFIIARSDQSPTYNLTVVVDDADMQITHVTRGDDHINNTPKQINLLNALGNPIPTYAHLPMILGADGKRLSKRHGATNVMEFQAQGILPEALLNILVRLGWSHGDQEIFSQEEMIQYFDCDHLTRSAAIFDTDKLNWYNQHYLKTSSQLPTLLQPWLEKMNITTTEQPALTDVLTVLQGRCSNLMELAEQTRPFYQAPSTYSDKAQQKCINAAHTDILAALKQQLGALQDWTADNISTSLKQLAKDRDIKFGKVAMPLRAAMTGGLQSPSVDITAELIGQSQVLLRLEQAIEFCQQPVKTKTD